MENYYKIKPNEKAPQWRKVLCIVMLFFAMAVSIPGVVVAQAFVTSDPAWNASDEIEVCMDGSVTVTVNDADIGQTYRLRDHSAGVILQSITATTSTVVFDPVTYTSTGSIVYRVFDLTLDLFKEFYVDVLQNSVAPILSKNPDAISVFAGSNVSAILSAAGSGGVDSYDHYEFRTKTGSVWDDWAAYSLGTNISTTDLFAVEIRALRTPAAAGLGCDEIFNVYAWEVHPYINTFSSITYATLQEAVTGASGGQTIEVAAGSYHLPSQVNVNKAVTIRGNGTNGDWNSKLTVSGSGYRLNISAAAAIENLEIEKTDKVGVQNIIYIGASNITIQYNKIHGQYEFGDGQVERAMEFPGGLSGLSINNNTIHNLRQPAYINGTSTGTISSNYTYNTRGWVLDGGDLTFTGNTWGINVFDIAILSGAPGSFYTDIVAVSEANNDAVIEDQRVSPAVLSVVYVDISASSGGNGGLYQPYQSINQAVARVVEGGKIFAAEGTYIEAVTIDKRMLLQGSGENTIIASGSGFGIMPNAGGASEAKRLVIRNLKITGSNYGIHISQVEIGHISFENLIVDGCTSTGLQIQGTGTLPNPLYPAIVTDLIISGCKFNNAINQMGMSIDKYSSVDGLTIIDSEFNNNRRGFYSQRQPDSYHGVTYITNVIIQNTKFNNNRERAVYLEKLDNATFDNIELSGNGYETDLWNTGLELNLKYDDYENISIINSTITGNGLGNSQNFGTGLNVKARDDGSYASNPASLNNLFIENNIVANNQIGIGIGEYGKQSSSVSNISINNNSINTNSSYNLVNALTNSFDATCNWWGSADFNIIAPLIDGIVDISTYLVNNTIDPDDPNYNCEGEALLVYNENKSLYYATIQAAIDAADNYDVISAGTSTFYESIEIGKPLTLQAASTPVIDGGGSGVVITISSNNVTLNGLIIQNGGQTDPDTEAGILVFNSTFDITGVTIQNCTIQNNATGIAIVRGTANTIQYNVIRDNIYNVGIANMTEALPSTNNVVFDNEIYNCAVGVYVDKYCAGNEIEANEIYNFTHNGIYLWATQNNVVTDNMISGNNVTGSSGIQMAWGSGHVISGNTIQDNDYGIQIRKRIYSGNTIENNIIINNDSYAVIFHDLESPGGDNEIAVVSCNWWGSADYNDIYGLFEGNVDFAPYLLNNTIDQNDPGYDCGGFIWLVYNVNQDLYYPTIQAAIDDANPAGSDVIEVPAGTYEEILVINKAITLNGPNKDKNGYALDRVAEAIIQYPGGLSNGNYYLATIDAGEVIIKGFTFNDNVSGGFTYDGTWPPPMLVGGVRSNESNTLVENNRFIGFNNIAVRMTQSDAFNQTVAKVNNTTRYNYFEGGAVYHAIYYQASAGVIEYNRLADVSAGVQIQPYFTNAAGTVTNNEISMYSSGLYYNYANWTIDENALWSFTGNTITAPATAPVWNMLTWNALARNFDGIRVETYLQNDASAPKIYEPKASFTSNTINGVNASTAGGWLAVNGAYFRNVKGDVATNLTNITFSNNTYANVEVGVQFDDLGTDVKYDLAALYVNGNSYPNGMGIIKPYQIAFCGGGLVTNITQGTSFCSIQVAIDAADGGDQIQISDGVYAENIVVDRPLTISGESQAGTKIIPAFSGPNPGGAGSIPTGSSNVILIQAHNVTIQNLTVDGNNPDLTSGLVVNGEDLDARNGIITNHSAGTFNNLNINNVLVKNIYLRGIYASSGGTFSISNNTVTNVAGEYASIAMMNWSGQGSFTGNTVTSSNDGIVSNHSKGTTYSGNNVSACGSGIHTDNNTTSADQIFNNTVNGCGYGIFVFAPYVDVAVYGNTITNSDVGLASAGTYASASVTFTNNLVDGQNKPNSIGFYSTTEIWGYPSGSQNASFSNNFIQNTSNAFLLASEEGFTNSTTVFENSITGNTLGVKLVNDYTEIPPTGDFNLSMNCNWWGFTDVYDVQAAVAADVNFLPFLTDGTDSEPGISGFQPVPGSCNGLGPVVNQTQGTSYMTIQAAIDEASDDDVILVSAGTYVEDIIVDKPLTLLGPNAGISPNTGTRGAEAVIYPKTSLYYGEIIQVLANNVTIDGFTIDGDNPDLTSGYIGTNGADLDAAEAITVYYDNVNNLTVKNNIIKNQIYFGVTIFGSSYSAPSTSGHLVNDNRFMDMGHYDSDLNYAYWGGGVLIYNDQYTRITNNVMTNVRIGIQTGNFHDPNPGDAMYQVIDNNTIEARRRGIFYNLHTGNAVPLTLSNNNITALANSNETVWDGILMSSLSDASGIAFNNVINGSAVSVPSEGYEVWNVKSNSPALISGGSVTGVDVGLFANNFEGYNSNGSNGAHATVSGLTITTKVDGIGVYVLDSPQYTGATPANIDVSITDDCSISGAANGILAEGTNATVTVADNLATITGNKVGIRVKNGASLASVTNNTITNNTDGGIIIESTAGTIGLINDNDISGNGYTYDPTYGLGLQNDKATVVDATGNWWGTASGPYHSVYNTCGTGNAVVGLVAISPWLDAAGGSPFDFLPVYNVNLSTYYCKIQDAIDDPLTTDGHTIQVAAGSYPENVLVDKELIIAGAGASSTTILSGAGVAVEVTADNVTIEGFEIKHTSVTSLADMGILLNMSNGSVIQNNLLTMNSLGVQLLDAGSNYIYQNEFAYNAIGIYLEGTTDGLGNFDGGSNGPFYSLSLNNVVEENFIHNSVLIGGQGGQGIYLDAACEGNEFLNNTISDNDAIGYYAWKASNNTITGNLIQNNTQQGIQLQGSSGNTITDNTVTGSQEGFWMRSPAENVADNIITDNIITGNDVGLKLEDDYSTNNWAGKIKDNTISYNQIYGNTTFGLQVIDVDPATLVDATSNWWGSNTGPTYAGNPCGTGDAVSDNVVYDPWSNSDLFAFDIYQLEEFTLTGTTSVCIGGDTDITLSGSQNGGTNFDYEYYLYNNGNLVAGSLKVGDGDPLTWTVTPSANSLYTVKAVNNLNLCELEMDGEAKVYVGPVTTIANITGACQGSNVEIPVTVTSFEEVGTFSLTLNFNPSVLAYQSFAGNALLPGLQVNNSGSGVLKISWYTGGAPVSLNDGETTVTLNFTYLGGGASNLAWDDSSPEFCEYGSGAPDYVVFCDTPTGDYYIDGSVSGYDRPEVIAVSMLSSDDDEATWTAVSGDLGYGYDLCIDPMIPFYHLDIDDLTSSATFDHLEFVQNAFYLNTTGLPTGFYDYWDAKGVDGVSNAGGWELTMWQIINGNEPMFYISYDLGLDDYRLIDGLQYQIGAGDQTLRVSGDYPQGTYVFTGTVTDEHGCESLPFNVQMTFNTIPYVTAVSLQSSEDEIIWDPVNGDLDNGYALCIDPAITYYYFDIVALTSTEVLQSTAFEQNAFYLDGTYPPSFFDYWAAKGVVSGAGSWKGVMWDIINGNAPMFYVKFDGSDYTLIDGLQYQFASVEEPLRVSGDNPADTYTFTGSVTAFNGCPTSPFSMEMSFNTTPFLVFAFNGVQVAPGFTAEYCYNVPVEVTLDEIWSGVAPFDVYYTVTKDGSPFLTDNATVSNPDDVLFSSLLDPGVYVINVTSLTDGNGCSASAATLALYNATVTINEEPEVDIVINDIVATYGYNVAYCFNETITAKLGDIVSGSGPVDIAWDVYVDGGLTPDPTLSGSATGVTTGFEFFSGLLPYGTYELQLTSLIDANGCEPSNLGAYAATIVVNQEPEVHIEINNIVATYGYSVEYCYSETITAKLGTIVSGTGPVDVAWEVFVDGSVTPDPTLSGSASGVTTGYEFFSGTLAAGVYELQLTSLVDANGCEPSNIGAYAATITINEEPALGFSFDGELAATGSTFYYSCYDEVVTVTLSHIWAGTAPFDIAWTVNGNPASATGVELNDVLFSSAPGAGTYVVQITSIVDANGCSPADYAPYTATAVIPVILNADVASTNVTWFGANDGTITITNPTGGYGTYEYSIDGGANWQSGGSFTGLVPGFYNVQIRDAANTGCVIVLNAALEITEPAAISISGYFNYYNTAFTVMNNVKVDLVQGTSIILTTTTDINGYYWFGNVQPGTYEVHASTDKPSGGINVTDAAQVNAWGVTPYEIEFTRFYAGDVVLSNHLAANDAGLIQSYFMGGGLPWAGRPNWTFWKSGETIAVNPAPVSGMVYPAISVPFGSTPITQDFYGLVTGDFNMSFIPGSAKVESESLTLNYGNAIQVLADTEFELPLLSAMDMEVGAISLILNYPSDKVDILGAYLTNDPDTPLWFTLFENELRIGWYSFSALNLFDGDALLTLQLRITSEAENGEAIYFSLAADPLNELADGSFNVIENAVLTIDVIEAMSTGINHALIHSDMSLANNPNPFMGSTTFSYNLPADGKVTLEVYSSTGEKVVKLIDEFQSAGAYSLMFNDNTLKPGVYAARLTLQTDSKVLVRTVTMIRHQ